MNRGPKSEYIFSLIFCFFWGCAEPAAPRPPCDDQFFRTTAIGEDATASFLEQLPTGSVWLTGNVFLDSLEISDFALPSNVLAINCVGAWGCQLAIRRLTLKKTTDWVLLWNGVTLIGGDFTAEYLQASRFTNLYVVKQSFTVRHSTDLTFRDLYAETAVLNFEDAGQIRFDGGAFLYSLVSYTGAEGANGWAGRFQYMATHTEFTSLQVSKAQSADLEYNVFIASVLRVEARKRNIQNNDYLRSTLDGLYAC